MADPTFPPIEEVLKKKGGVTFPPFEEVARTAGPAPAPTNLEQAAIQPLKEIWPDIQAQRIAAQKDFQEGIAEIGKHGVWAKSLGALQTIGAGFDWALSPVTGAAKALISDPFERLTKIPHSSEFITNTVGDAAQFAPWAKVLDALAMTGKTAAAQSIMRAVSPTSMGVLAQMSENNVRAMASYLARDTAMVDFQLGKFRKLFVGMTDQANHDFIDAIENPTFTHTTPELQPVADYIRSLLDHRGRRIQRLGRGQYLKGWIDNYFPHIWQDPNRAADVLGNLRAEEIAAGSKRPLKGSADFLKKRTIESVKNGLDAGLKLVSNNPLDLVALKVREMDRFFYGTKMMDEMKAQGILRFFKLGERRPPGWRKIDDPAFRVFLPPAEAMIDHFAAYDPEIRKGLEKIADYLGIKIETPLIDKELERGAYGYTGRRLGKVVSRFGGDEAILMHEIGHQLDYRYRLAEYFGRDRLAWEQLRKLALQRAPGSTNQAYIRYLLEPTERIANLFHAYWHAPAMLEKQAPRALLLLEMFLRGHPDLQGLSDLVKPSVQIEGEIQKEHIKFPGIRFMGEWYGAENAARIVSRYLSKKLESTAMGDVAKVIRMGGNSLNMLQLGLSGFHFTFTTIDTITSRMALSVEQAMRGEIFKAAKTFSTSPIAPVTGLIHGSKLRSAYLDPGNSTPQLRMIAEALTEGGGRISMDTFFRASGSRPFFESMRDGTYFHDLIEHLGQGSPLAIPFKLVSKVMQDTAAPLMEYLVPRQKLGVFYDMAEDYLSRNPNATKWELRQAMKHAWDSVDNRMGQMVYDNLFWHNTAKDMAFILVRSVGWNIGTVRELGGGLLDTGRYFRALNSGQQAQFTSRMAYALALPVTTAMIGAAMTYLYTGHGPTEVKDYFFPPTGKTVMGAKERVSIPGYIKDVVGFNQQPGQTVVNKLHPLINLGAQWYENLDFYGGIIVNPNDPTVKQVTDWGKWLIEQETPFSFRGFAKLHKAGAPLSTSLMSFFGFQPAPLYVTNPQLWNMMQNRRLRPAIRKRMREEAQ